MKQAYLKNVSTLKLDPQKCIGCGRCIEVCPHAVFSMQGMKAQIDYHDACMECGACVRNCPTSAIDVHAGVGCAAAILTGWLRGTEPSCGGTDDCCK